jgi:hypothetical protein
MEYYVTELTHNAGAFHQLLHGSTPEEYLWRPAENKWCLLEIVCHLLDEEKEDFRARVHHILHTPDAPMTPIDPQGWVQSRKYLEKDFEESLAEFEKERIASTQWITQSANMRWGNEHQHPTLGTLSAKMMLANWVEHDYLHLRQILNLRHALLLHKSRVSLDYAGNW